MQQNDNGGKLKVDVKNAASISFTIPVCITIAYVTIQSHSCILWKYNSPSNELCKQLQHVLLPIELQRDL